MSCLLIAPLTVLLSYMSLLRKAQKLRCKHMAISPMNYIMPILFFKIFYVFTYLMQHFPVSMILD